jgi:hypothetical protein
MAINIVKIKTLGNGMHQLWGCDYFWKRGEGQMAVGWGVSWIYNILLKKVLNIRKKAKPICTSLKGVPWAKYGMI